MVKEPKEKRGAKPGERRGGRKKKFREVSTTLSMRVPKSKKGEIKKKVKEILKEFL